MNYLTYTSTLLPRRRMSFAIIEESYSGVHDSVYAVQTPFEPRFMYMHLDRTSGDVYYVPMSMLKSPDPTPKMSKAHVGKNAVIETIDPWNPEEY